MLVITGWGSRIVKELLPMLPVEERAEPALLEIVDQPKPGLPKADRFLFCSGLLRPVSAAQQTPEEMADSYMVNLGLVIRGCELILAHNDAARICVVGSESAYRGSFDGAYASAKAGLHAYVESAPAGPRQQIVCVSPGIIQDAGMTIRRTDRAELARRRDMHPKRRYLRAVEVARMIHFLLYVDEGYTSGTVVRMHGGLR